MLEGPQRWVIIGNYSILFADDCVILSGEMTSGQVDFIPALHPAEIKRNYAQGSCYRGSQDFSQNTLAPLLAHGFPVCLHCTYIAKSILK